MNPAKLSLAITRVYSPALVSAVILANKMAEAGSPLSRAFSVAAAKHKFMVEEVSRAYFSAMPVQASCADEGTSTVRFHVVSFASPGGYWSPACNTGRDGVTMMSHQTRDAHAVPHQFRCRRPACRKAFELADNKASS